jgi:hypothetical protein
MTSVSPGDDQAAAAYAAGQAAGQGFSSQSAEFFLQNYRLGKTLGIGSFGKVRWGQHNGSLAPPCFCRLSTRADLFAAAHRR